MVIHSRCYFKKEQEDKQRFTNWVHELECINKRTYSRLDLKTSLGNTVVWGINSQCETSETLVIFPGVRTTALFWDLDRGLDYLGSDLKVYMVETNGLPNLSDGNTPDIRSNGYGVWASEILDQLNIDQAYIAGASFGGLICMKLCLIAPSKVKASFLLNPGCLQRFSLSPKNLFFNLLPILWPNQKTVELFLNHAIFCKPNHMLSREAERMLSEYELFALKQFKDNAQKPYDMGQELNKVRSPIFLMLGDKDLLFPCLKSMENARTNLPNLKEIILLENVAHGIEVYNEALKILGKRIAKLTKLGLAIA
ncbi:Pimeloyl-ACP methyl ester carboxylesterase [Reichenbachiella faecimaris]|uniref:Pimeloyl-ACP methyl ester carboxylesterase n=1 Tax=Reichenbachiella faecimaris TaxID=692418 RepID=A0A1W2GEA7_REIFA|nr:alpha/beta fold hydrolase [Reichenbachiella faecimaris]SMD34668.1 Pimeloyl-ACP methyl ester carboxylesterase [Reichenbachiella faecimaris]